MFIRVPPVSFLSTLFKRKTDNHVTTPDLFVCFLIWSDHNSVEDIKLLSLVWVRRKGGAGNLLTASSGHTSDPSLHVYLILDLVYALNVTAHHKTHCWHAFILTEQLHKRFIVRVNGKFATNSDNTGVDNCCDYFFACGYCHVPPTTQMPTSSRLQTTLFKAHPKI